MPPLGLLALASCPCRYSHCLLAAVVQSCKCVCSGAVCILFDVMCTLATLSPLHHIFQLACMHLLVCILHGTCFSSSHLHALLRCRRCTPKLQQTAPAHVMYGDIMETTTQIHAEHTDHTCFNEHARSILEDRVFDKLLSRAMMHNCFATCLVKFLPTSSRTVLSCRICVLIY